MKFAPVGGAGRFYLNFIEIVNAFTFYGIDVILLAVATAVCTQIVKKLLFKKAQKKMLTFLPFIFGIIFYAVYAAVSKLSLLYVFENYVSVIEHGISVGAVATLFYVLYEQFVREKSSLSATERVISTLIEGYVPTDSLQEAAKAVAEAIARDVTGNGAKRAEEIIAGYSGEEVSERDICLLSKLIIETLANLTTKQ